MLPGRALWRLAGERRGRAGERLAARHLARAGLRPIARRLLFAGGELDLVCRAQDCLVVVEVKTGGAGERFRPAMRVRRADLVRRVAAARALAARTGARAWRVDVVEVVVPPRGRARVIHHQDAGRFALGGRAPWETRLP